MLWGDRLLVYQTFVVLLSWRWHSYGWRPYQMRRKSEKGVKWSDIHEVLFLEKILYWKNCFVDYIFEDCAFTTVMSHEHHSVLNRIIFNCFRLTTKNTLRIISLLESLHEANNAENISMTWRYQGIRYYNEIWWLHYWLKKRRDTKYMYYRSYTLSSGGICGR